MRIAFLGTPEFALPSLRMLVDSGHDIIVLTQPDKPKGRKRLMCAPPVKIEALKLGLPVFQFERIKNRDSIVELQNFRPDVMVTAAFGQILSREILGIPKHGCINVHGSLLPKYRGAAPIQSAIIAGERKTGITTMLTDVGLDTGDILLMRELDIYPDETAGELSERLALLGATVLRDTLERLQRGELIAIPQDSLKATRCGRIEKENARIDFSKSSVEIHNLVRGMNPDPCAYAMIGGEPLNIWRTKLCETGNPAAPAGECVIADPKKGLFVATADGLIEVTELQFRGAKRMDAKTALNGRNLKGCFLT